MNKLITVLTLASVLGLSSLTAGTVNFPKDKPVASVTVPEKWTLLDAEKGIGFESPDQVATIYLEVTTAKGIDTLIDDNIDWLTKDQGVKVDQATESKADVEFSGMKWSRISWDATSKEWGPSVVGFCFTKLQSGKMLTITYWITKKDSEKQMKNLDAIFETLKEL